MLQYNHKTQCVLEKGSHKTLNSGQQTAAFLKLKVKFDLSSSSGYKISLVRASGPSPEGRHTLLLFI